MVAPKDQPNYLPPTVAKAPRALRREQEFQAQVNAEFQKKADEESMKVATMDFTRND